MRWCKKCVLPDTRPNLKLGKDGICNACKSHGLKEDIDWNERLNALKRIVRTAKSKCRDYDCLIPVSGGKDSTWQVVKCLELGLKPLALTWRPPGRTEIGQKNLDNLRQLGVDHIDYSINPRVEAEFMLESLRRLGSTGIPMHMALFNIPTRMAFKLDIPLIVWGENSAAEYGSVDDEDTGHRLDSQWVRRYGVTQGTTAKDWVTGSMSTSDLAVYKSVEDKELDEKNIFAIFLGYYLKWDPQETKRVAIQNGFKIADKPKTGFYEFADIDDKFISVHHWLKWYKFGFSRLHDNLSLEIRNGRITREEAKDIIKEAGDTTPHEDIEEFCLFAGISYSEFMKICERHRNHNIWQQIGDQWVIPDYIIDEWDWA